ncbi:MAG: succinate dehydrogenase iron-sulfur subunit [Candidatus Eisenbacteria bacterium]|uniref:succinate dehydrogenase n=1 Tax=Eiseniibacteriota bacterium TaxID=2212470 RepID=A0A948W5F7_UNCEI|nr:succinate dehydrogenase iron-sulfur subunit [Candidatus Eisenbacteria bacterium]MBU1950683.1 succinate dehydrogenase iron-sulfur subunit [Candidatus Eisenbacteria bacterium]MBU2693262.1 succinate dehydrogenase iron-sulfur subunit [Candidatus Eisenbacteria bacterium]
MPDVIRLKIKRQENPNSKSYWEEFEIPYRPQHNIISVLMAIQQNPINAKGEKVAPVVYEANCMEEVCGACTMIINGKVRQACSTLVDNIKQPIVLEPMSKFPLVRDLMVDRDRMFAALRKIRGWIDLDGAYDIHVHAPRVSPKDWEKNYDLSRCMTCGCCMEACPQFFPTSKFIGPAPLGQTWLFNNHPTGKYYKEERLHEIMGVGGITDCGNAQNCVKACPKDIKLTDAIARLGRDTTVQMLKDVFIK